MKEINKLKLSETDIEEEKISYYEVVRDSADFFSSHVFSEDEIVEFAMSESFERGETKTEMDIEDAVNYLYGIYDNVYKII